MEKYYLTQSGKPVGPWTREEVELHLKSGALMLTDYFYDEEKKDWALLVEHPHFSKGWENKVGSLAPAPRPAVPKVAGEKLKDKEWYALKGDNRYGPFSQLELIKMLQGKQLFEFDYVWNAQFSNWTRIADCPEFQANRLKALHESGSPDVSDVFFRRRHARVSYGASLVVHNNKTVWKGESLEISPGGCGIRVENEQLKTGQSVFLHFKVGDGVPPFNAICEIVSKVPASPGEVGHRYGVKFTNITRQVQLAIQEYTQKAA